MSKNDNPALTSSQAAAGVDASVDFVDLDGKAGVRAYLHIGRFTFTETCNAWPSSRACEEFKEMMQAIVSRLTPSPAPAARANLTEDELEAIGYARHDQKAGGDSSQWTVGQLLAIIDRLAPLPAATEGEK
jgi:hypothetical protein